MQYQISNGLSCRVNEIFYSIQGEGRWTGTASIFVRLQGCEVGCPWCDTKYTWETDDDRQVGFEQIATLVQEDSTWAEMTLYQLLEWQRKYALRAKHIIFTGGEPLNQKFSPMMATLLDKGFTVQVETSGTAVEPEVPEGVWVTLSPKINMPGGLTVLSSSFKRANEVKLPMNGSKKAENLLLQVMRELAASDKAEGDKSPAIYLQPISKGKAATANCIGLALKYGFGVSVQVHKYLDLR